MAGRPWPGSAPSQSPQKLPEPISLWGSQRDCPRPAPAAHGTKLLEPKNVWSCGPHSVSLGESLQLAQAGNSLQSIWAASLVGSEPLEGKSLQCAHREHIPPSIWAFPLWNKPICFAFDCGTLLEKGIVVGLYLIWEPVHLLFESQACQFVWKPPFGSGNGILDYTSDFLCDHSLVVVCVFVCIVLG